MSKRDSVYQEEVVNKKGVETYLEMVRVNPTNSSLRYELGWLYEEIGLYEEAVDQWLETIKLEPNNLAAREAILAVLMKRKELSKVKTMLLGGSEPKLRQD